MQGGDVLKVALRSRAESCVAPPVPPPPGAALQGDGSGTANIYGRPFSDDVRRFFFAHLFRAIPSHCSALTQHAPAQLYGLALMHDRPGILMVANAGTGKSGVPSPLFVRS